MKEIKIMPCLDVKEGRAVKGIELREYQLINNKLRSTRE